MNSIFKLLLVVLCLFNTLASTGQFNNSLVLLSNEPDSFRKFTADVGIGTEFTIGDVVAGLEGNIYFQKEGKHAFQLHLNHYLLINPPNPLDYKSASYGVDEKTYYQIEATYSFLPWKKEKVKNSRITVGTYGNPAVLITKELANRRIKRYGFRFGISHSKLPVRAFNAGNLGLNNFRDSKGKAVVYNDEYRSIGSTTLLSLGMQTRKQIRYLYDIIRTKKTQQYNTAIIRDLYFDFTYLAYLRYTDIIDRFDQIEKDGKIETYSIEVKDNPIYPLGFRLGLQTQHQGGKYFGVKIGAEVGCRYGIGSSSFAAKNFPAYYVKLSLGIIILPDPRK